MKDIDDLTLFSFFFHTDSHQHAPHSLPIPEVEDMSILKVIAFQRSPATSSI